MKDFSKNIKQITTLCIFLFVGLIAYIAYYSVFKGPTIAARKENPRHLIEANKVLRGSIFDRNKNVIAQSKRGDDGWQIREYPVTSLYGAVVGYSNRQYGNSGLEDTMNEELLDYNGKGAIEGIKDLLTQKENKEKLGYSIVTTLDNNLQQVAVQAMNDAYSDGVQGFNGSVVAIEPKTGNILAMVTKPTYDPNNVEEAINNGISQVNKATSQLYPPGSIFKTITTTAAVDYKPTVLNRTFNDTGKIEFADGTTLNNFANQAHGKIDLKMAYRKSSNFVFGTLGMELPNYYLRETAERFGFNSPVDGIGISAIKSNFPELDDSQKGDKAQTGIGQGLVSTTPLQMAMMASAVANNGVLMTPKLISSVVDDKGNLVKEFKPKVYAKDVLSEKTDAVVKDFMKTLVADVQYSPSYPAFANFRGLNAGGKTGTADWVANSETNELGIPHGWFVAIAPVDDPKIAIAVVCEEGYSGSHSAAYVAATVVKYYLENNPN